MGVWLVIPLLSEKKKNEKRNKIEADLKAIDKADRRIDEPEQKINEQ